MEMRHLRYFLAVAEHSSFTRAAEAVHVSQPSLSVQIAALEEEVGVPLFDRLGRRVILTEAGQILREHAERVVHDLESGVQAIHELKGAERGRLTIGALSTVNSYLIPPLVSRFRRKFPNVSLHVQGRPSSDIIEDVLAARLDMGVCLLPVSDSRLAWQRLFDETLCLVAPTGAALSSSRLRMRELAKLPLVLMPADYCLRKMIDAECRQAGVRPQVSVEMTSPDGILEAVRQGAGFTILPTLFVRHHVKGGGLRMVALRDPVPKHPVGLIHRANRHLGLAAREFIRLCRDTLADFDVHAPDGPSRSPRGLTA
jgi:DNA-binding transcriptional LysR family regulator